MPGLARVGRNAPCPCGSGRKYKVCCLPRDEAFEIAQDGLEDFTGILLRVMWTPEVAASVERLWERYWPEGPPKSLRALLTSGEESDVDPAAADLPSFLAWVIHGAPLEDLPSDLAARLVIRSGDRAPTLLDVAMGDHEEPTSTRAGVLITSLRNSLSSAFQVTRRQPGRRLWVRDVFTDEVFEVGDRNLSEDVRTGEVLLMRIRPLEGIYEAVGAAWRFPASAVRDLRPWGEWQLSALREFQPNASWRDLWRERGELLHHYVVERRRHPLRPEMRTTTGEEVVLCRIEWAVRDREAVVGALDGHGPEFRRDDDTLAWVWLPAPGHQRWTRRVPEVGTEFPGAQALPGGPALGHVVLDAAAERLTLETMSLERAEAGRALIEAVAGSGLAFLSETRRSVEEVLAEQRNAAGDGPEPDLPPAELRRAAEAFIADYERRWVDMTIPALGGKTPRQAAASADPLLRRQLEDLFLEMEEAEARAREHHAGDGMSVARLRRLLGMADPSAR